MKDSKSSVQSAVYNRLKSNSQISRMGVEIEVDNSGIVTLRGNAHGHWSKELAQDLVSAVPGVSAVKNELTINPPPPRLKRFKQISNSRR